MMEQIILDGKEMQFVFDTKAWVEVEKIFGSLDRMYKCFEEDMLPLTAGLKLAAITATSAMCKQDEKKPITFKWLVENASPKQAREMAKRARAAVAIGLETTESLFDEEGPEDAGLEEENAKKTRADA